MPQDKLIDGSQIAAGDVVLGLKSSGVHSNGFSLVRKILEVRTPLNKVKVRKAMQNQLPWVGHGSRDTHGRRCLHRLSAAQSLV